MVALALQGGSVPLRLELSDSADDGVRQQILAPLLDYNASQAGASHGRPLIIVLRDEADTIQGGLWGYTGYEWLFVQLLVVPASSRRAGLGRRLMALAESEAVNRQCREAWLDTFEFQARGFYERLGYTCFATLPNYPTGFSRYFMKKALSTGACEGWAPSASAS